MPSLCSGRNYGCGSRIWTSDLRVMSPTSYQTAPSRGILIDSLQLTIIWVYLLGLRFFASLRMTMPIFRTAIPKNNRKLFFVLIVHYQLLIIHCLVVPRTGIEPVRLYGSQDFKSCASACSATPAFQFTVDSLQLTIIWVYLLGLLIVHCQLLIVHCLMAPRVGFEPTTYRLTAECSTIELPRNM